MHIVWSKAQSIQLRCRDMRLEVVIYARDTFNLYTSEDFVGLTHKGGTIPISARPFLRDGLSSPRIWECVTPPIVIAAGELSRHDAASGSTLEAQLTLLEIRSKHSALRCA